jgi:hypothetical protein
MSEMWRTSILEALREIITRATRLLPNLLAMATLIGLGLLCGSIIRYLLLRSLRAVNFDVRCQRWGVTSALARTGIRRPPSWLLGSLIFWVVFLFFGLAAVEALDLPTTANLLNLFFRYLPHALAAALVLVGGWLIANFLGQATLIASVNAQIKGARALSLGVRWAVIAMTVAMALSQLGIAREVVVAAFSIAFGGAVLALALAFGLGGKDLAREFLERRFREQEDVHDKISHL